MNMTDVCHGWTTTNCMDMVLVVGIGVIEDQAQVLFTLENRAADLVGLVDKGIGARWPGHTHLHLKFGSPSCAEGALTLPVSGSQLKTGASGSAAGFHGVLQIAGPDRRRVSLRVGS